MRNFIITLICLVLAVTNYAQNQVDDPISVFMSCDECHAMTTMFQEEYGHRIPDAPIMETNKYYMGVISRWDNIPIERRILKSYYQYAKDSVTVTETWLFVDKDFITLINHDIGSSTVSYLFERHHSFVELRSVEENPMYTSWTFNVGKKLNLAIARFAETSTIGLDICCDEVTRQNFITPYFLFTIYNEPSEVLSGE